MAIHSKTRLVLTLIAAYFTVYTVVHLRREQYTLDTLSPQAPDVPSADGPQLPLAAGPRQPSKIGSQPSLRDRLSTLTPARIGRHRTTWSDHTDMPQTTILKHITGWTVFENLYAHNGTFYIVSEEPKESFPPIREMISTGYPMENHAEALTEPTDKDMRIITTWEATRLFGDASNDIPGVSFIANDCVQFFRHYYHFMAEIFFGLWRIYSSLDELITEGGDTWLPPVSRFIFPNIDQDGWRDEAEMNNVVIRAVFPSIAFETKKDWKERSASGALIRLQIAALTERTAAVRGKDYGRDDKMAAMAHRVPGSPHWWAPIRRGVLEAVGVKLDLHGRVPLDPKRPFITYVSRQGRGRALSPESHDSVVAALDSLRKEYGWETSVVMMENYSKPEQIAIMARTTILLGVHGNGLTSLLWMQPSPTTTVIEIFKPGGYKSDYQFPAEAVGIEHYAVWNNTYIRSQGNTKPDRHDVPGIHGKEIPAYGPAIADLIVNRVLHPATPPATNDQAEFDRIKEMELWKLYT